MSSEPEYEFNISVKRPGHYLDNSRLAISPKAAAKIDEDQFLAFAAEVRAVAEKIEARRGQLELPLGGQIEKE